jgi:ATP adenylyltransferase
MFAPWRAAYVTEGVRPAGCVFCLALEERDRPESLVVHEGALTFVVMNLYPYNAGHLMVAPRRHVGSLGQADTEELAEMMALARHAEGILGELYKPDGINLGLNLGKAAGAGVADHIHLHVVPRWAGDTNFMTVAGGVRVIPEEPREACARLRPAFLRAVRT